MAGNGAQLVLADQLVDMAEGLAAAEFVGLRDDEVAAWSGWSAPPGWWRAGGP
jgi:hypothetical protein